MRLGARKIAPDTRAAVLLVVLFWGCTFGVLTIRGAIIEPLPFTEMLGPRALITIIGALFCAGSAVALSLVRPRAFKSLVILALCAAVLMSALQAFVHILIYSFWYPPVGPTGWRGQILWTLFWLGYFLAWTGTYLALLYHRQVQVHEQGLAAMRDLAKEAQITALRYQINPHFLFNTINSISSLVLEGRSGDAERMLMNLAEFLRSTITMNPAATIPLRDEVALQELYLDIEKVRFSNRLKVRIDIPDDVSGSLVPALILQPLVENAVKHGVSRSEDETVITVEARREGERLMLAVSDDAQQAPARRGTGKGIQNVRDRLEAQYGLEAKFDAQPLQGRGYRAELLLPLERAVYGAGIRDPRERLSSG